MSFPKRPVIFDYSKTIMWRTDDWINIKIAAALKGTTAHKFVRNLSAQIAKNIVTDHEKKTRQNNKES